MIKPWEGKNFQEMLNIYKSAFKEQKSHESDNALGAALSMQDALIEDWEERVDFLPPWGKKIECKCGYEFEGRNIRELKCPDCAADTAEKEKSGHQELFSGKYGQDYWFKFRDSIYEVGKPTFSIVSNGEDENPKENIIRISDCKFDVFIDVWGEDKQDSLERAEALCKVLNAEYPFHDEKKAESFTSLNWKRPWIEKTPKDRSYICVFNDGGDGDDYLTTGLAVYNDREDTHYIEPDYLQIDAYMRFWCELPKPPGHE
jgi:predicted Zn-ribbon and HTH transcriptional regulator